MNACGCSKRRRCDAGEALYRAAVAAHGEHMYVLDRYLRPGNDTRPTREQAEAARLRSERSLSAWADHWPESAQGHRGIRRTADTRPYAGRVS